VKFSADGRRVVASWKPQELETARVIASRNSGITWSPAGELTDLDGQIVGEPGGNMIVLGDVTQTSADGGATWNRSDGPRIADDFWKCCPETVASSHDARTVAALYIRRGSTREATGSAVAITRDYGARWLTSVTPPWTGSTPDTPSGDAVPVNALQVSADGSAIVAAWSQGGRLSVSTRPSSSDAWPAAIPVLNQPARVRLKVRARGQQSRLRIGRRSTLVRSVTSDGWTAIQGRCRTGQKWLKGKRATKHCGLVLRTNAGVVTTAPRCGVKRVRVIVRSEFDPIPPVSWRRTWKTAQAKTTCR